MITVEMTDDITKYENKEYGPFTTRQVKAMGIGALYSIPIAALIPTTHFMHKFFIFAFLMFPAVACGFAKMNNSYLEFIAARIIYFYFLTPRKRKMITKIPLIEDLKKMEHDEEQKKISKMTAAQKKKYMQSHGKKKVVNYSNKKELKVYK